MTALKLSGVAKTFTMHLQCGVRLPVIAGVTFEVAPGECVALVGPSGVGKSSILKMIYGNYRCDYGQVLLRCADTYVDVAKAEPRRILALRREIVGYVTQFLRAVPRVPTLEIVAEPSGKATTEPHRSNAAALLRRLNVPERLWSLPPATFSGGEQQRINIARGLLPNLPILLLDEPTASLDAENRKVVVDLIAEKKRRGTAIVGIMHDEDVRNAVADRIIDVTQFTPVS